VREQAASVVIDAGDGFGHPAGVFAVREYLARARRTGVAVAGVFNSTHFGTAGYYAEITARDGMIGVATTNSSPRMAP
jgi:LDH2 family malate/lactate/ureidoglycolate dehydrogenase